jgi:hypothetical protein
VVLTNMEGADANDLAREILKVLVETAGRTSKKEGSQPQ